MVELVDSNIPSGVLFLFYLNQISIIVLACFIKVS